MSDITNEDRAARAEVATAAYYSVYGQAEDLDNEVLGLMVDLLHLLHREGCQDPSNVLHMAKIHFETELRRDHEDEAKS